MNIEQANALSLPEILQKIGCVPVKDKGNDLWYLSPFREEKTASFHINTIKNVWYDFGSDRGGDVINFAQSYLQSQGEDYTPADALRWVNNMMLSPVSILYVPRDKPRETKATLTLSTVFELEHKGLINYLESRRISLALAKKYLKEVVVNNNNTGKKFHAIGWQTVSEGYEVRNKVFKGCIGSKSISFIRGKQVPAVEIHVFEGIMDFISAVSEQKGHQFMGDAIILNSVSCLPQSFPYIKNYAYRSLYTWLDNDTAGLLSTHALKELAEKEGNMTFQAMNKSYSPHKDVNAWHMDRPKV